MASAYGNTVHHWRSRVVAEITSQTATQATVRTRAYWCSIGYGYEVYANGEAITGSYSSGKKQFVASSGTGQSVETLVAEVSHTYNKGAKAQSIPCKSVVQVTGGFGNGTSTASTSVSVPAIDYDAPAAPSNCSASRSSDAQAKVMWSNGATGTTTPRSATLVERQADGGAWSQIASVGAAATNYTDNSISANHRYAYRVRAQGAGGYSGYATSGYIYTTPAAPSSVLAEKTGAQSVRLSIEGAAPWATSYDVERSTDGGSQWASAGTAESFPWVDADAPAGTVAYRVRAVRGSLQSAWSQSNSVTTITPPLAPAVTGLPAVAATGSALTVSWLPNHPDGSEQTQAQIEYQVGDGGPQTATVEGAATSYQLPASATESAGTVKVRVRTHGLDEDWGAWSGYSTVAVAVPPSAHFTNPASDGATVAALPLALAWEASDATGVSSQTLSLLGADGTTLLTRQLDGAARSFVIDDSVYALANLSGYELVLTVLGGSSLSTVAARSFTTDWAEPAQPTADLETDPADLSCAVTVHAGEGTGDEPDAVSFSVVRVLADGSQWMVADGLTDGQQCIDPLPPLNVDFAYLVTAYAETGVSSALSAPARVDAALSAFNFGDAAATCELARLDPSWSHSPMRSGTLYHFADGGEAGGLPVPYGGADVDSTRSMGFTLLDLDQLRRLQDLAARYYTCWYRDVYGGRALCAVAWSFSSGIPYGKVDVSADMTEAVFEEAW